MHISRFISVGENIHCTRIYKTNGKFIREIDGKHVIEYITDKGLRHLPIPEKFINSAEWEAGRVKHCAVAIWQGTNGTDADRDAGVDYLKNLARRQEIAGATYLDLNVDEYSTDIEERVRLMKWLVDIVQSSVLAPMSIDSSNTEILRAGLSVCDTGRGKPMLNSVSLERQSAIALAAEFNSVVIASAAGEEDLPADTPGRLANIEKIMPMLTDAGLSLPDIHIDPLVFPISTDGNNGRSFLDAVAAIRGKYGKDIHFAPGLSNISFGMPNRKLLGQVFTRLFVESGGDGGIVDPFQVNVDALNAMDTNSESFRIAKAVLTGEDDFGMNYITACRAGTI